MFGDEANPNLGAKAGETYDVTPFLVEQLRKHRRKLSEAGPHLLRAVEHLLTLYHLVETNHRRLSVETQQKLLDSMLQHNAEYQAAGGVSNPKHHQALHLCLGSKFFGNPKFCQTYTDEHENGVAARIGKKCHPLTFAKTYFEKNVRTDEMDE